MNGVVSDPLPSNKSQALSDWLIWQLTDSAFPVGGFAHSGGLEAAWQQGEVESGEALVEYLETSLAQAGHGAVPLVTAAFDEPLRIAHWDELCDAFTSNHVAKRASRVQGRAWCQVVARTVGDRDPWFQTMNELSFCHFTPIYGAVWRLLGISRDRCVRLFMFSQLRSWLSAAVRLNVIGPMEAQVRLHELSAVAERVCEACELLSVEDLAQVSPLLDVWQGGHDRLYSRLFQS